MAGNRRKNRVKKQRSYGIYILVIIGILFLFFGVLYGKYVYDGIVNENSETISESVTGLTVGALHDVQENSPGEGLATENGSTEENAAATESKAPEENIAATESGVSEENTAAESGVSEGNTAESESAGENAAAESENSGDHSATDNDGSESDTGLTVGAVRDVQESSREDDNADAEITIVMIGDMLMHTPVLESGKQGDGTYNFDHLFTNVADKIASADIAIVNQETIMGGDDRGFSGYPTFNTPTALADAEAVVGFDVILHGTNHALDKGASGILNCINYWETNYPDIAYLGINKSQEAQDTYIYVYEQDGISVAILNYTYGTNGISTPSGQSYLVNYLDEDKVVSDIERAHELANFVIVCPHWGTEYNLGTDSSQAKWTQIFLEEGVDLVIGTHPHVIEPVEWVTDDEGNEMLVYYSLGNFVNGTSSTGSGVTNRMVGGMAEVTISIEDGEVVILEYDAIPLVCHMGEGSEFTVYYLSDYTEELAQENQIISQDSEFSLEKCWKVVEKVWGAD